MKITFWGVRGSHPAIAEHSAYGNETSCVEVSAGNQRFIFDAGTGIHFLGKSLMNEETQDLHLFFTHYHLDHVSGLLNFQPVYQSNRKLYFYGPSYGKRSCEKVLKSIFNKPYHPIGLDELPSEQGYQSLREGSRLIFPGGETDEEIIIETLALNHPGGALGYKVTYRQRTFVYITDVVLGNTDHREDLLSFIDRADLVVTDTTFSNADYEETPMKRNWGHSSWEEAVALVKDGKAKRLMLFHLDPNKTDAELDRILDEGREAFPGLDIPREGEVINLEEA